MGVIKRIRVKSSMRRRGRVIFYIFAALLVCALIFAGVLFSWNSGKLMPFADKNGNTLKDSISEKIYVNIHGIKQGMFIRGKKITNPVLLFVHGGPGMPEYFLTENYPNSLEDYFTVCYWEQRGAGLSYNPSIPPESVTVKQQVSDTLAVTDYLRERSGQDKIYLMGHSYGTFIGIQAAAQAPEKYRAYIGIAQISRQLESEKLAYDYMLKQYKEAGNKKMAQKLESYPIHESDTALHLYLSSNLRDEAMHKLGIGTMHNMKSVVTGIFLPVMQCRAYTLGEKINIWRGKAFLKNSTELINKMYSTDLTAKVAELGIPVYFFSGIYDYTVSYKLAAQYFDKLKAPVKGFYTFEKSAHSPNFEEPDKFIRLMLEDVLEGKTGLSDKK